MAPVAKYAMEYGEQVELLAGLDIGTLWDRMRGEFLNEYARLQRTDMSPDDLERELMAFIDGLSPRFEEDLARKSSGVAYNAGREAEIKTRADRGEVEWVVRSEVLDENTCAPCSTLDGSVVAVKSPEFRALAPPYGCEGGNRCRGFYVAVPTEMG